MEERFSFRTKFQESAYGCVRHRDLASKSAEKNRKYLHRNLS